MYILAGISKDGQLYGTIPCTDDTEPLLCTQAARAVLVERLMKANGKCKRCGIFARSEELVEGHCVETIGCGKDTDIQEIIAAPGPEQLALITARVDATLKKWAAAINAVEVAVEEATPTPSPVEDANDVLRDW